MGAGPGASDVLVTTVEQFAGEQADIVLLSLVRSNEQGKLGFTAVDNRVCVALSRARHGFYIAGNAQCPRASKSASRFALERS